jgi:hypothetical protein
VIRELDGIEIGSVVEQTVGILLVTVIFGLSASRTLLRTPLSPEELDENESLLSPLLPLSLPGPPGLIHIVLRTTVGELSLEVVSGALLSTLAIPTECFLVVLKLVQRKRASHAL